MYTVIGNYDTRAMRVVWALEEMGLPYKLQPAEFDSELVKKHNPLARVPVLLDGDEAIADSMAIICYLADKHGKMTAPHGTLERARQDAKMIWLIDEMDGPLSLTMKYDFEALGATDLLDQMKIDFAAKMKKLEGLIEGEYLMGDELTVPDILAAHNLLWAMMQKFGFDNPAVAAYGKRIRSREAFKRMRSTYG